MQEMMFNFARIAIVLTFVENSGGLLDLSIGFIHELKTGFIGEKSLFALLDEQLFVTQKLSEDVFHLDTDYIKLQGAVASLMIWLGSILVLASSAIIFIAAEVGLALLTATSPIFIGCLTYGFTRELFNGWLRSIFSCIITLIFATLVVKIGIGISYDLMSELVVDPAKKSLMGIGGTAFLTGIIVSSLVFVAAKMAGNIAGVAATSAIQGGMTLAAKAGITTAGKTLSKKNDDDRLKSKSQDAAFARVQQTNSEN